MLKMNGAQALVRLLRQEQVGEVFGIASGKLTPLLHAVAAEPALRFTGLRHEAAAPLMAAAVHAESGRVAVALGEMGPGSLNVLAGLGTAFNNNLAVLVITTNQHRAAAYPHSGMFMDLDSLALFKPLVKWNATVNDPRRLPELVRRAFREALSGRPGPVHLDVPQDVLSAACEFADDEFDLPPARYRATGRPRPASAEVRAAAALLHHAQRPVVVVGGGVIASGAEDAMAALARRLDAPVVPTQMALGAVASDSPHFIGHGGLISGDAVRQAFDEADVVLAVGCRFSSWMWDERGPFARRGHRTINVNIDPSALGQPAVHEIALQADALAAAEDLLAALPPESPVPTDWLNGLRAARVTYENGLRAMARSEGLPMHPAALAQAIAEALPANVLAVYDGGHTSFWSNDFTPVHAARTRFHDPGMCQLGFGLPYALALQLLHPGRPVVNITGDGSFGFTLQELDTARRHGLPVVTIIHNNEAWGIIRAGQKNQLDFELGTGLAGTDYAAIARGFGCWGESVARPAELAPALERALASGLPAVIDCRTRFEPHPSMPAFGRMNRFGFDAHTRPGE